MNGRKAQLNSTIHWSIQTDRAAHVFIITCFSKTCFFLFLALACPLPVTAVLMRRLVQ